MIELCSGGKGVAMVTTKAAWQRPLGLSMADSRALPKASLPKFQLWIHPEPGAGTFPAPPGTVLNSFLVPLEILTARLESANLYLISI